MEVKNPANGAVLARVACSGEADVNVAVAKAKEAFASWSTLTLKARTAKAFKMHALIEQNADKLAKCIVAENGKTYVEALASVSKANETWEWACSLPALASGRVQEVSRGFRCEDTREPVGVVRCTIQARGAWLEFKFLGAQLTPLL